VLRAKKKYAAYGEGALMKKFLASRGVGGALGGWGAPLAVAPGAALPWWRILSATTH